MRAKPGDIKVEDLLKLRAEQMLVVNKEYQRGPVWTRSQQKRLVDSVLRGYPIPLIYLHHIRQEAGGLTSERFEVIDGQQRITALHEYREGAFKLFHPVDDEREARFPDFVKRQACPWGGLLFKNLPSELKDKLLGAKLPLARIETDDKDEARDLFVRLQAGMPLNPQEKRDALPGQFTDFILRLAGKKGIARYPGHDFFSVLMGAGRAPKDRGKFRVFAAQVAMLYLRRRRTNDERFCDTGAQAIDDFYYEMLSFDADSPDARRLEEILDKLYNLLRDGKRKKLQAHEAIHLVLLLDTLWDDYTRSWEKLLPDAFDRFRSDLASATKAYREGSQQPGEHWLSYGFFARSGANSAHSIQRRQNFFATKMLTSLRPQLKDPKRLFGSLEREIIYYRDKKQCAVCDADVFWHEAEVHHIHGHNAGGATSLENGVLVHQHCHPRGQAAVEFAAKWKRRQAEGTDASERS